MNKDEMKNRISFALKDPILQQGFEIICKELEAEKKLNAEIKARFVKCNTCTDDMKSKCLMFSENLCQGERCEELVDLMSLINKSDLEKENAELKEKLSEQKLYTEFKCNDAVKKKEVYEKEHFLLTKAKELLREIIDTPVFNQMGGELYENEGYIELVAEAEQFLKVCK